MKITLPWVDPSLNPNRTKGMHWASTSGKRAKRKADARLLTLQAMRQEGYTPPPGALALDVTFVQPDKRRRDRDNLLASLKHDLDGISQALGVDDQHFEPVTIRREYGSKPGAVIVVISC